MKLLRVIAMMLLTSSAAFAWSFGASAQQLDKEACAKLQVEQKKLLTRDVQAALERGPDWVKDHLDPNKIEQVRHYLQVEEMAVFRCRTGGLPRIKPTVVPLPDRKPALPTLRAAVHDTTASVTPAAGTPLPDRKPASAQTAATQASQTVADSDKTAPSGIKATP